MSLEQIINRPGIVRRFFNGVAVGLALMYAVVSTPACNLNPDEDASVNNSDEAALSVNGNMCEAGAPKQAPTPPPEDKRCYQAIINMKYNSTVPVTDKAHSLIEQFIAKAKAAGQTTIYVGGFSSPDGVIKDRKRLAEYNLKLSERRSESAGQEILTKGGEDVKVLTAGYGETTAIDPNDYSRDRGVVMTTTHVPDINSDDEYAATLRAQKPGEIIEIKCADPSDKAEVYAKHDKAEKQKVAKKASRRASLDKHDGLETDQDGAIIIDRGDQRFRLHDLQPGNGPEPKIDKPKQDEPVLIPAPANAGTWRPEATPLPDVEKPVPPELARKVSSIKMDATRLSALSKKYSNMIDVIINECSPGAKAGILCSSPEYGRLCSDGNPMKSTAADKRSACTQATITARSGLETTALEASNLEKQVSGISHVSKVLGVEDKVKPDLDYASRKIQQTKKRTGKLNMLPGQFTLQDNYAPTGYAEIPKKCSIRMPTRIYVNEPVLEQVVQDTPSYKGANALADERAARRETAYCSYHNGTPVREISNSLGVSRSTVYRDIKKYEKLSKSA